MNDRKTNEIHRVPQKTNESQHSAVKYFDKCFSSLQMTFMQYDYVPRFI